MSSSSSGSTCPPESTLTYDNFGQTFFGTYCVRCHGSDKVAADRHGAPVGYDWDEYESIALHANEIDTMAAGGPRQINRVMPPGEPLPSDAERRELGRWLACELDVGR
jgi:mono/diheme cytochrome c family protein